MNKTRVSLYYLASYLTGGGLGLLFAPRLSARLFQSNGDYPEIMLRALGMFLLGLAILVIQIIRLRLEVFYPTTLVVRVFFCFCLAVFYFTSRDPFFAVLFAIVFLGFLLTGASFLADMRQRRPDGGPRGQDT